MNGRGQYPYPSSSSVGNGKPLSSSSFQQRTHNAFARFFWRFVGQVNIPFSLQDISLSTLCFFYILSSIFLEISRPYSSNPVCCRKCVGKLQRNTQTHSMMSAAAYSSSFLPRWNWMHAGERRRRIEEGSGHGCGCMGGGNREEGREVFE